MVSVTRSEEEVTKPVIVQKVDISFERQEACDFHYSLYILIHSEEYKSLTAREKKIVNDIYAGLVDVIG